MRIRGDKRHRRRLKKMRGLELVNELGKQVFVAADAVRGEAQFLIAEGSIQGAGHVPSAPGEAPNLDEGGLTAGITAHRTGPLKAVAESAAPYALAQEYGATIKDGFGKGIEIVLPERPYMRPAAKKVRGDYLINIRASVSRIIRKG